MRDGSAGTGLPLERAIGVRALALTAFSLTVGSGIFGLPGPAADKLGRQAVVAYLVCAAVFGLVGLCLAEAGSRVTRAGGLYGYVDEAFGPLAGWIAATLLWFANCVLASAAVANLLVDTLALGVPFMRTPAGRAAFLIALYATLVAINVRTVRLGVKLSELAAGAKALPLVAFIVAGAFFVDPANLRWSGTPQAGPLAEASLLLFFAFMGVEGALCASGEVRRPERTVPLAILLSLALVSGLYISIHLVAQGILGDRLATSDAPLVAAASAALGQPGATLLIAATVLAAGGYFASDTLASPRTLYALAADGQLPRALARVHPRFHTPANAIGAYAAISAVLALSGTFRQLAIVSSAGTLLLYLGCCLAVPRLRARQGPPPAGAFTIPGGPLVPLLASGVILWLLASLRALELGAALGLVTVAFLAYAARRLYAARS